MGTPVPKLEQAFVTSRQLFRPPPPSAGREAEREFKVAGAIKRPSLINENEQRTASNKVMAPRLLFSAPRRGGRFYFYERRNRKKNRPSAARAATTTH